MEAMLKILIFVLCTLSFGCCDGISLEIFQGKLVGKSGLDRKGNVFYSFLSIPYAKSPLGDLRFKTPIDKLDRSGIYKLKCNSFKGIYIGQSGRNFKIRLKEHLRSFRLNQTNSKFANHLIENRHSFDEDVLEVIHFAEKGFKMDLLESLEIHKAKSNPEFPIINDQPPQEPEKWDGVLNATNDIPSCSQLTLGKATGQEDCLYLNVHTPKIPNNDQEPLKPVFFYIHGGAFIEGSGNNRYYGGEFLVPAGVIVVTINYRLGLFGFVSSLDESLGIPGNAGLKDQTMALRWVQKNIRKFGGDPNNVMIVGESAGGACVHLHTLSPASKGLFHKAISMSGTAVNSWAHGSPGSLEILGRENLGIKSNDSKEIFKALNGLSTADVLELQKIDTSLVPVHSDLQSSPVIENNVSGAFLTSPPLQIIKDGDYNKVPHIFGYTNKEGLVVEVANRLQFGKPLIINDFSLIVPRDLNKEGENLKELKDKIKAHYFGDDEPSLENLEKSTKMFTGAYILSGISKVLNTQRRSLNTPTYFYRISADTKLNYFKQLTPETAKVKGTSHVDDLGYLFKTELTPEIVAGSPEDLAIDNMVTLFTNFAKFGKPSDDWLPLTAEEINYMEIGISSTPGSDPDEEEFKFWNDVYEKYSL